MVHVASHSRHRQHVSTLMTFASVSMILPEHCGHAVGRATGIMDCVSAIALFCIKAPLSEHQHLGQPEAQINAITIANVSARFCLSRLRLAPAAIHCAQRRSDACLASADIVAFCRHQRAILSDSAANVCSVLHRGLLLVGTVCCPAQTGATLCVTLNQPWSPS